MHFVQPDNLVKNFDDKSRSKAQMIGKLIARQGSPPRFHTVGKYKVTLCVYAACSFEEG